jgi:hypothetical protein
MDATTGSILAVILIGLLVGVIEYIRRRNERRSRD